MFFRRRFIGFIAVGFLIMGLFGMARSSAYRVGWSQGFASGQAAVVQQAPAESNTESAAPAQSAPAAGYNPYAAHPGYFGYHSPFGWFIGGLFKLFLFLIMLKFIFGFLFWGMRGRRRWGKHHRHWGHHGPPWRKGHHGPYPHGDSDGRSEKERYYDEHGPDSPIVDL